MEQLLQLATIESALIKKAKVELKRLTNKRGTKWENPVKDKGFQLLGDVPGNSKVMADKALLSIIVDHLFEMP